MNQWIQLGLEKDSTRVSCLLDDSFSMLPLSPLDRDIIIDITRPVSERFFLTPLEALNFACQLPEIKALIHIMRQAYEDDTIYQNGYANLDRGMSEQFRDVLKPFEGKGGEDE